MATLKDLIEEILRVLKDHYRDRFKFHLNFIDRDENGYYILELKFRSGKIKDESDETKD